MAELRKAANSLLPMLSFAIVIPFEFETFTLYGGSVRSMSIFAPPSSFFTSSRDVESPHIRRCVPSFHKSHFLHLSGMSSISSSKLSSFAFSSFSFVSSVQSSGICTPKSERARSLHSFASISKSQAPNEPLSLMTISFSFAVGVLSGNT